MRRSRTLELLVNFMKIPFFDLRTLDQDFKQELINSVSKVLDHGKLFLGPEVEELEARICDYVGCKYAIGVGSGSSALYLALKACGIGVGDEVITTPLTWVISANAIAACGATPVFADVLDDFTIDANSVESLITRKTKAIVPMHYAGKMCDMPALMRVAATNNLLIIEDAAQAFGASLSGKKAGMFSTAAAFSMNPMKAFGGYGEAGMVVTNEESIYHRVRKLRHAGTTSDPKKIITNYCEEVSLNHKMDTINAAMLLVGLNRFPARHLRKEAIANALSAGLGGLVDVQRNVPDHVHARYVYPIRTALRNQLKDHLEQAGVETKIMHEPLVCDAPVYKHCVAQSNRARVVLSSSLIIPSHDKLSAGEIDYIVGTIKEFMVFKAGRVI